MPVTVRCYSCGVHLPKPTLFCIECGVKYCNNYEWGEQSWKNRLPTLSEAIGEDERQRALDRAIAMIGDGKPTSKDDFFRMRYGIMRKHWVLREERKLQGQSDDESEDLIPPEEQEIRALTRAYNKELERQARVKQSAVGRPKAGQGKRKGKKRRR